ncbi:uncharacterized protein RhoGAP102A [Atheta coriaria]|uniref:uncharacterized protein RhoGAP102A n=1 Tax=Dalotia coriaria TaxID=877792 RepID=UPI0031F349F2
MAERMTKRRLSRLSRSASAESSGDVPVIDPLTVKSVKRMLKKPKERWLLTRKTWRYMADAGRKLIPEGAQNRPEDLPKIEAYFQEVCKREPRFLLWRKNSYPGALSFRKKRKNRGAGGSCRKASSADEALDVIKPERPKDLALYPSTSGGRFDIQKMKYDFLNAPPPTSTSSSPRTFLKNKEIYPPSTIQTPDEDEQELIAMLEKYLEISNSNEPNVKSDFDYQELVDKLQRHLTLSHIPETTTAWSSTTGTQPQGQSQFPSSSRATNSANSNSQQLSGVSGFPAPSAFYPTKRDHVHFDGDHVQKSLQETLSRYFSQSPSRDRIISDLLTNRKALQKLYFDLRQTKGFRGRRDYPTSKTTSAWDQSTLRHYRSKLDMSDYKKSVPPPLIEIQGESSDPTYIDEGTQTYALSAVELAKIEEEYKKMIAERNQDEYDPARPGHRRRSSVDDVSQSVSDHIKRYLRMARKKSSDADKVDRFKRVNYDRNLRNIKAKGEITKPGDDDGLSKGSQTNEEWILNYTDLKFDEVFNSEVEASSSARSSIDAGVHLSSTPTSPTKSHSFLSSLLHKHDKTNNDKSLTGSGPAMQKSKSSSSVVHQGGRLMAKTLIFKRSKSQSRPAATQQPCTWTPKGSCCWNSVTGKQVVLTDTPLQQLSEIERKVLQKVALAKLQALNLGVTVKIPSETTAASVAPKKRRPYLLKRKALTTGIFDTGRKDDKEKQGAGLVFGIPLSQCVENDRLNRLNTSGYSSSDTSSGIPRAGSRASFSSLIDATIRADEKGSCESLAHQRIAGSVPGLLDELSCSSTADIDVSTTGEEERAIPHVITECIRHLEANGLHTLGLFRVSASKKRVRELRESFDSGKETMLSNDQCPHDVATLLKEFMRDLPDPLLCRDLYNAFVQTQRIRNRRLQLEALQHLVQLLPAVNRDTLAALLNFLVKVAKYSNDQSNALGEELVGNKMNAANLATVFAPNVLHSLKQGKDTGDRPEDRLDVINVVRTMIDNMGALYTISAELLDEVYVHMMDTHPAALEELMNKRESTYDESQDEISDGSAWSPVQTNPDASIEDAMHRMHHHGDEPPTLPMRKTYSREEFLHESAATGGPNVAMRIRHKERSLRRRRESSGTRRRDDDSGSSTSSIAPARVREAQAYNKTRSSSLESTSSAIDAHERTIRMGDIINSDMVAGDRRKSTPYILDQSGIITASLTIPVQTTLNIDNDDIPYIEDGMDGKLNRSPQAPPRRRQRSMSGSDSSIASTMQPVMGSISLIGYDSAIGSSITQSSPPHNTTPSSVSSSMDASGICSSPPSWASTPPTSPDSHNTTVNYIPDDVQPPRQYYAASRQITKSKDTLPMLQKVSYTSTSEIQRAGKPADIRRETPFRKKSVDIQKCQSTPVCAIEAANTGSYAGRERFNPSITSIGNAVLRSRTADFERITKTTNDTKTTNTTTTTTNVAEKKKYTKRRYTDLRHQTRHIPDAEALEATQPQTSTTITSAVGSQASSGGAGQTVYKRRELISSAPSASH